MNRLQSAKQMKPIDPMSRSDLMDGPDSGGGQAYQAPPQTSVKPAQGNDGKTMQIDGPYGGKVKA